MALHNFWKHHKPESRTPEKSGEHIPPSKQTSRQILRLRKKNQLSKQTLKNSHHEQSPQISKSHQGQKADLDQNQKIVVANKKKELPKKKARVITAPSKLSQTTPQVPQKKLRNNSNGVCVFSLRDIYTGKRFNMAAIGIDIGTKNVVLAVRKGEGSLYLREINGYFVYPRSSKFVRNMLDDPNKIRSDGSKRPARWIEFEDKDGIYVLGGDAEELAYSHNDTLQRPMAEGGISQDEDAMMVLASIVQSLLEMAEKEVGKFKNTVEICYCTTAPAINKASNIDYHKEVVDLIIQGYESSAKLIPSSIKESHAIVLKESEDGTGIGISWGAGTVTVSYVKWGDEIYSFCWVGAGDWIDTEVARRHGYDPDSRKKSSETPTTVCRQKEKIDLTPGHDPEGRVDLDIVLHYKILISNVVRGIIQGFEDNEDQARIDDGINVYMAGGTSSPKGFCERVQSIFEEHAAPFEINGIHRCDDPLYAVAEGCLIAAEMS